MFLLILYLFIALFFSFLCSILEAVVLSITPSYIALYSEQSSFLRKELKRIKEDIDEPLSAILTLNTFAHTLGAAGVGAQAQKLWGEEYLSVISALLTILILILSEIIPKTIGASNWKSLAPAALRIIRILIFILYPFVSASKFITKAFKREGKGYTFTRKDLQRMVAIVQKEGGLGEDESRIIQNLLTFNKLQVRDIMTPRKVVFALPENEKITTASRKIKQAVFSRIPIYTKDMDEITGFVLKDELLTAAQNNPRQKKIVELRREMLVVPRSLKTLLVLEKLIQHQSHIALVVDEYGGTEGIVTMEDIIEHLLGMEIMDEVDSIEDLRKFAQEKWQNKIQEAGLKIFPTQSGEQEKANKGKQEKMRKNIEN